MQSVPPTEKRRHFRSAHYAEGKSILDRSGYAQSLDDRERTAQNINLPLRVQVTPPKELMVKKTFRFLPFGDQRRQCLGTGRSGLSRHWICSSNRPEDGSPPSVFVFCELLDKDRAPTHGLK
jgi:hypothetical protein